MAAITLADVTGLVAAVATCAGALASLLSAGVLFVVAALTRSYAKSTQQLVSETRSQREPQVWLMLGPRDEELDLIELEVFNNGPEGAYDISFIVNAETPGVVSILLKEQSMIKNGITYLAPGQRVRTFMIQTHTIADVLDDTRFSVDIAFRDNRGVRFRREAGVDLRAIAGNQKVVPTSPLKELVKEHKKLVEEVKAFRK